MKSAEIIGAELASLVTGDVHVDIYSRTAFSMDASIYRILPQCVVSPKDEVDIVAVVCYAAANEIPMAPRGAGSGVAGESLTSGIVLDVRRYMNRIIETAEDGSWVRVQPGIVLDVLNKHLARWGRTIGPDPSSSNRAVVGGVVANNATGAHSLEYGYISNYVEQVRAVLSDGAFAEFRNGMTGDDSPAGRMAASCLALLGDRQELIRKSQPVTKRNRCGYTIQDIVHDGHIDMSRLLTGSEGTLAVFSEITLRTVEVPKAKGLVQFEFAAFEQLAKAVPLVVQSGASACEMMDRMLMDMARNAFAHHREVIPQGCAATLLVEHTGQTPEEVLEKITATEAAVGDLADHSMRVLDAGMQARLWKSRKDAVPLLNREKGASHPVAFIEDVSVDHGRLDEYIAGLEQIGRKYNIPMAFYGHAGDGELHIRPYLDLSRTEEVVRMRQIAQEVFALAWSLGGTISGEHGDGLLRSAFIEAQYGKEYYELLRGIKRIFDPKGILNPGKIVTDDPELMEKDLRAMTLTAAKDFQTELAFKPNEFRFEVEQCNGCGVCLSEGQGSRMCPVFRGLNEELGSSRAKANLLSTWMAGPQSGVSFDPQELKKVLSLCVNCKMCSIECPAGVDVSKLIVEARTKLAKQTGFTTAELALSHNRLLSILASTFSPLSNWILSMGMTRWFLEKLIGLDRSRRFPRFERGSFINKAQTYLDQQPEISSPVDHVVYFVDSYANWNDHALGFAVVNVLRRLGINVVVPKQRPVPLPAFVYGNIKTARRDLEYSLEQIAPYIDRGYKVVCSEPSAALCLKEEMRLILDSEKAKRVASNTYELMDYLQTIIKQHKPLQIKTSTYGKKKLGYHAPCHLKSLRTAGTSIELLKEFGIEQADMNGGCCGLAGTAGMQKKHHDLADAVGRQLYEAITQCNPDMIVTECAACKMQIEHLTGKPVLHPVKLLAQMLL